MRNKIKKAVTKVIAVVMFITVLFASAGQEVQAAKQIAWPYGTYVSTGKQVRRVFGVNKIYLSWTFGSEPTLKYPESISIYLPGNDAAHGDVFSFRNVGTNKYRSKKITSKKHYLTLKVSKSKAVIKEIGYDTIGSHIASEGRYNFTFKLKKRMSKNVS